MFAIAWQYLYGCAVAAEDAGRHKRPEWPPSPDRVFQALVAAWGTNGRNALEKDALEWLERQAPPAVAAPEATAGTVIKVFVPVNDKAIATASEGGQISHLPLHRKKEAREFASTYVGQATVCALIWPEAEPPENIRSAFAALCARVTHIGHSRSLVRMWVENTPPLPSWVPAEGIRRFLPHLRLGIPFEGRLAQLEQAYFAFSSGKLRRNEWPRSSCQAAYMRVRAEREVPVLRGAFSERIEILSLVLKTRYGLVEAIAFVRALRQTMIKFADGNAKAMSLISGHDGEGKPLQQPHVAFFPLAYVGAEHADGHLMGMAVALPKNLDVEEENAVLAVLGSAFAEKSEGRLQITAGQIGAITFSIYERSIAPLALQRETWTRPSHQWGSVTPIVLDRLPPRRHENADAWAAAQIAESCIKQGLPQPEVVEIWPVSPHKGAPPARAFPPLLRKPDGARRWHVHAVLNFSDPVGGPLLLGAGRYCGYGVCKPM